MKHQSVPILEHPCEFINITPVNPLISKCEIKVCYVSDEPNRNRTVITKEVAREMANSLPGSPIVGYYNETAGDFESHNRIIEFAGGSVKLKDTTRPYGFVDLGAKVWFQKFLDDGKDEREYLMTEGYLWTGQYPEAQRIIDEGNNQSMELSDNFLDGSWTKDNNGKPKFFIINEAIIAKLCILGEEAEPCFEGATITQPTIQFSFDESFTQQLYSMMNELKELITKGGTPMFTSYAVEIGDALWSAMYSYLEVNFPKERTSDCDWVCSKYCIDSIWEEGTQKFVILRERDGNKLYRLDFSYTEEGITSTNELKEVEKTYVPVSETSVFSLEEVEKFEAERYAVKKEEEEEKEDDDDVCPECGKPKEECTCEEEKEEDKKKKYSLEDIPEYMELLDKYSTLENDYNSLKETNETLSTQVDELTSFKAAVDKKEKEAMIDSFYMLSDEDKKEVVENIDTYSVEDIEAKLSIICVRNKVSFNLEEETISTPTTYSLNSGDEGDFTPAWIKSVQSVAKDIK